MKEKSFLYKLIICGLIIAIFLIVSKIVYGFFRLGDDTFIYLKYARSIIENGEVAFNLGEPTYGFTSPIWLLLLTLTIKITGSYFLSPQILTLFFSTLTIIIWFIIVNNSFLKLNIQFLFLLIIVSDPNLLKHSYFGMEASASFFLSSVLVFILHIDNENNKLSRALLSIIFGLYFLIRPESIFIYLVVSVVLFALCKITIKDLVYMYMVSIFVVIPWIIFSGIYFGSILPNTFAAKGADYAWGSRFFLQLFDSIKIFGGNYIFIIAAILLGIIFSFKKISLNRHKNVFLITSLSIIILIIFYSLTLNREFVYARYYCVVFPFIYWTFLILLKEVQSRLKYIHYYLSLIILSSIVITTVFAELTKKTYCQIELMEDKIALWVKENTDPSDVIVRGRIGKIGFLSERKILDPVGIINPEIIKFNKSNNSMGYYLKQRPHYFIGTFNMDKLEKYASVKLIKEFGSVKSPLLRYIIFGNNFPIESSVYKVDWH